MISLIIPVYNEERNLEPLYQKLKDVLQKSPTPYEILFIDDGSFDGSGKELERLLKKDSSIYVCSLKRHYGKSVALNVGFKLARGDIVFTMDADLQDDPEEIPRFLEKLENGCDVVSGWKKDRKDPLEKRIASRFFNFVVSRASGIPIHDFNCGYKAYKKHVLNCLDVYGDFHRFIPLIVADAGYRIEEIAVKHHPRASGRSKFGLKRYLIGLFDFFSIYFTLRYSTKPFHFIGIWAFLSAITGFSLLTYTFLMKYIYGQIGTRPSLFIGLFLVGFALNLLIFGFIADLIVRNTRPLTFRHEDYLKGEPPQNNGTSIKA